MGKNRSLGECMPPTMASLSRDNVSHHTPHISILVRDKKETLPHIVSAVSLTKQIPLCADLSGWMYFPSA